MLLKRHYRTDGEGNLVIDFIELKHTGNKAEQNFSTSLVSQGSMDGWITVEGDKLTMKVKPQSLIYTIVRKPGYYCCHDGKPIAVSPEGFGDPALAALECRAYLKANGFEGVESPDPSNPAGYMRLHAFECVLSAKQHEKFKAKPGALAPSTKQGA